MSRISVKWCPFHQSNNFKLPCSLQQIIKDLSRSVQAAPGTLENKAHLQTAYLSYLSVGQTAAASRANICIDSKFSQNQLQANVQQRESFASHYRCMIQTKCLLKGLGMQVKLVKKKFLQCIFIDQQSISSGTKQKPD